MFIICLTAMAQTVCHADGTVTFRLFAPKAVTVEVEGDFLPPQVVDTPRGKYESAGKAALKEGESYQLEKGFLFDIVSGLPAGGKNFAVGVLNDGNLDNTLSTKNYSNGKSFKGYIKNVVVNSKYVKHTPNIILNKKAEVECNGLYYYDNKDTCCRCYPSPSTNNRCRRE